MSNLTIGHFSPCTSGINVLLFIYSAHRPQIKDRQHLSLRRGAKCLNAAFFLLASRGRRLHLQKEVFWGFLLSGLVWSSSHFAARLCDIISEQGNSNQEKQSWCCQKVRVRNCCDNHVIPTCWWPWRWWLAPSRSKGLLWWMGSSWLSAPIGGTLPQTQHTPEGWHNHCTLSGRRKQTTMPTV